MAEPDRETDPEAEIRRRFDGRLVERLEGLVTREVLDEHRADPTGDHSPALARVLMALRRVPTAGKLALLRDPDARTWRVMTLSGEPGVAHQLDDVEYPNEREGLHEVLLRRLEALGVIDERDRR